MGFQVFAAIACCFIIALELSVQVEAQTRESMDLTRVPEVSGAAIVTDVTRRIDSSGIFTIDKGFLRRIAFVESNDGTHPATYRAGYHGGIWQIDPIGFEDTQNVASHPGLSVKFIKIQNEFGIDWSTVTWEDLRKPLYSGIAARLFLSNIPATIPSDLPGQARYWKLYYNRRTEEPVVTVEEFIQKIQEFERSQECNNIMDAYIVLDSSGSIGSLDFELAKSFVASLIGGFTIGGNNVRIGVITYSNGPILRFPLNRYFDQAALNASIHAIPYSGGGTYTGRAISYLVNDGFTSFNGARSSFLSIPRVAMVMTDGRSGDNVFVPAEYARSNSITLFSLGIGSSIVDSELVEIAGSSTNVFEATDFSTIQDTRSQIIRQTCNVQSDIDTGTAFDGTLNQNDARYFQITVSEEGITIEISVTDGSIDIYGSYTNPNPSSVWYDVVWTNIRSTEDVYISSDPEQRRKRQTSPMEGSFYFSLTGTESDNVFKLNSTAGNTDRFPDRGSGDHSTTQTSAIAVLVVLGLLLHVV